LAPGRGQPTSPRSSGLGRLRFGASRVWRNSPRSSGQHNADRPGSTLKWSAWRRAIVRWPCQDPMWRTRIVTNRLEPPLRHCSDLLTAIPVATRRAR
jgi:hypothetical protein